MEKEKILSMITSKDYNNELEKVLEKKDFSEDTKNLLLSCIYKLEIGYKDYSTVKRNVESKKEYIENIINIVKNKCNEIEIVKEDSEIYNEIKQEKNKYLINEMEGKIELIYPNEKDLLYSIYELNNNLIYVKEKYGLIRNSISELFNTGENINNVEVLRDFNGWSWDIQTDEIKDITSNIIYQNIIYLLGIEFVKEIVLESNKKDAIENIYDKLKENYGEDKAIQILKLIYKISILNYIDINQKENERLLEEKRELEIQFNKLNNKKELLNEISNGKKEALKKIKEIDTIINDKELLQKEFISRNEKLADYHKIFDLTHLTEILTKQRKKIMLEIEEVNKMLDPKHYIKTINEIEEKLELLENIEKDNRKEIKYNYIIDLQKLFLECIEMQIENAESKKSIIELIYIIRYYNFINVTSTKKIKNIEELQNKISQIQNSLLKKAYELKVLNSISSSEKLDIEIQKNIFISKIIELENIVVEIKQKDTIEVDIFDKDVIEKTIKLSKIDKDVKLKFNKKIKLFI